MIQERKKQVGWVLYDFANSAYHLMMPTVLMPLFFRQYLAAGRDAVDLRWAVLVSVPVILAGIIGPFLGAFADVRRCRLRVLLLTAVGAMLAGAAIPFAKAGSITFGGIAFGVSYLFFILSLGVYDAFLPMVAERGKRGRLSGLAWGIGYLGGIAALGIVYPILGNAELPGQVSSFRLAIWVTCIVYAVFSLPSFLMLRKTEGFETTSGGGVQGSWGGRVLTTLREWRKNRELFKTLGSYYLANDGLATLVYFTAIYAATTLGFASKQILMLFLIVQVVGVPASILGGRAADRVGHKPVLFFVLGLWVLLCVGFALCKGITAFYALSVGTGLVIGTTPAVYRSLLSQFIPVEKAAEMYGFNSFASRASSVLGPLLFGGIAAATGSQRYAMVSLLVFFVVAAVLLRNVREESAAQRLTGKGAESSYV